MPKDEYVSYTEACIAELQAQNEKLYGLLREALGAVPQLPTTPGAVVEYRGTLYARVANPTAVTGGHRPGMGRVWVPTGQYRGLCKQDAQLAGATVLFDPADD